MPSGTRRKRGSDEYIFVDGKAMRADEAIRIEVDTPTEAPGQSDDASVPGASEAPTVPGADEAASGGRRSRRGRRGGFRESLDKMDRDGLELRDEFLEGGHPYAQKSNLQSDDRRKMRRKYFIFGGVVIALILFSLCISYGYYYKIYNPIDVVVSYFWRIRIWFEQMANPAEATQMLTNVYNDYPMLFDAPAQFLQVLKYILCGVFLALAGMLYQNAFRNPIAAPSMLGVSNGVSIALLVLVMIFGAEAANMKGLYYLFSYIGGVAVLGLVLAGGKFISGKGSFNVVNMLLMGTVISQLLGVIIRYVQTVFMDEATWLEYYSLQAAADVDSVYTIITTIASIAIAVVPVFLFRFRLNLISFSDEETRLLGVNPNNLRVLALACGSFMILTAQVNAGQVAMVSLVIPFIVRAVFGAEFRKQFIGNIICGAGLMVLASDFTTFFYLEQYGLNLGSIISIIALPLFVWMIASGQRSWE